MQGIFRINAARRGWQKRAIVIALIAALVVTSAFAAAWSSPAASEKVYADDAAVDFSQPLDPATRTEKSSSVDYIAAKFEGIEEGEHVFDVVTYERLRKSVLQQDGNSVIVFGSAANETTKKTLRYINEVAQQWEIEKIYFFEPFLDGDRGNADITKTDGPAPYQNDATKGLWNQLKNATYNSSGIKATNAGPELAAIDSGYQSEDTYLFIYNRKGKGSSILAANAENVSDSIKAGYRIDSSKIPTSASDTTAINAIKTGVANAFGAVQSWSTSQNEGPNWEIGNTDETAFDQYDFVTKNFTAGKSSTAEHLRLQTYIKKSEDFKIKTVTQPELVNILNTPGKHIVFASGSWCGDSNVVIPFLADSAKRYNEPVYLIDLRIDASYTGLGDSAHILRSEGPKKESGATYFSSLGVGFGYSGIAFLSAEIIDLLAPFHAGENNDQVDYYPNGDQNAELKTIPQTRFRSPFLVRYEKGDNNLKGKVIDEWYHTTAEYEKPYKQAAIGTGPADAYGNGTDGYPYITLEEGTALDYELNGGTVNIPQKALGRANLDTFFSGAEAISHTAPRVTGSEEDSELDSGCGDDNDRIDNLGESTLIPNHGTSDYDVQNYDITIQYDPDKINYQDSVTGKTTITATAKTALSTISLDFRRQAITSVKVNGSDATYTRINDDDIDKQKLNISANVAADTEFTVEVEYTTGAIEAFVGAGNSPQGFSRETGNSKGITAIGEPFGSTYWFPNNNTPSDGATYTITLIAPSAFKGVSSGKRTGNTNNSPSTGQRTTVWEVSKDTAPYQVFATLSDNIRQLNGGSFAQYTGDSNANPIKITLADGTEIDSYAYANNDVYSINTKTKRVRDKIDTYVNKLPFYIQTLESIAGKFPGESVGFVFNSLTDGAGGTAQWGALETQNRPYYTNSGDVTSESIFVHEYTHQWFGDAVRIADWNSLWLNEGFATYVTDLYYEKAHGVSAQNKYKNLYNEKGVNSLLWKTAPVDIKKETDLFGGPKVAYNRGALALAALREIVGDTEFFDILKGWVPAKNGQAVKTQDFIDYAQGKTETDLTVWVAEWLYGTSKPAAWPNEETPGGDVVITPLVNLDGGSFVALQTLPTLIAGRPFGTLPIPEKSGYTFAGWYVNNDKIEATSTVPSATFTLVARWKKVPVTDTVKDSEKDSEKDSDKDKVVSESISAAKVAAIKDQVYSGKVKTPQIKVTLAGKTLAPNTDYTVAYKNNKKIGKATVTVTGKGKYKDKVTATFKIVPKTVSVKSLKAGKKKFTLKWGKVSGITRYQLRYKLSTAKSWKSVAAPAKSTSKAVSGLKKGKKYQVQIRAYKTVSKVNYYSAWSKVKTVKIK